MQTYDYVSAYPTEVISLITARATLTDLLIGRYIRGYAEQSLNKAIHIEQMFNELGYKSTSVEEYLDNAVHIELVAIKAEQGLILWGGRLNRCGYQPKVEESNDHGDDN